MEEKERFILECGRVRTKNNANFKHIEYEIDDNGCWNCVSHRVDSSGYPQARVNNSKMKTISRIVYEFYKEKIKDGNVTLHSCDNPKCINPEHLIQGTHQDNMKDMIFKNRRNKVGSLTIWEEEVILDIYDLYHQNIHTQKELSQIYNLTYGNINKIVRGVIHKKLTQTR